MNIIKFILLLVIFTLWFEIFSQGCNDAGLCTLGDFGSSKHDNISKYQNELTYSLGLGEQQTIIQSVQYDNRILIVDNKLQISLRVPFHYIYGNLAQTYGVGDISLGLNYIIPSKSKSRFSILLGTKLPVNDANKSINGKGLPMVYQTSLGTYDLMAGVNMVLEKWHFGVGYQQPFGENKNTFTYSSWEGNQDALNYFQSAYLTRGSDAIILADRYFLFDKNSLKTGLLAIYRVEADQIIIDGETESPDGSKGLTLNVTLEYKIPLKNNDKIRLTAAAPLITREYRTDGLTRTFVLAFTYTFGKRPDDIMKPIKFNIDN